jgi:GntR family transcriptional repressor for pyruvate dehydrogenase complex
LTSRSSGLTIVPVQPHTAVSIPNSKPPAARFRALGNKDGLVTRVVQAVQGQILGGRLAIGTKLPPEREFAERLGVSRTVLREAVRILVTKGLLETRHGIGTMVRAVTREEVVKPLTLFLGTCGQEVSLDHLHQVRSILEVENAGLAAEQASDADIEDLRRTCAEMESAAADPQLFAVKDDEFHRCLAQTTHNPLLILLLDSIHDLMAEVRTLVAREHGLFERVMPTHMRILECVAARDARGARRAMREHLVTALSIQNELVLRTTT